jgi:hypothetical protein
MLNFNISTSEKNEDGRKAVMNIIKDTSEVGIRRTNRNKATQSIKTSG